MGGGGGRGVDNFSVEYLQLEEEKRQEGETVENAIPWDSPLSGDKETGLDQAIPLALPAHPCWQGTGWLLPRNTFLSDVSFQSLQQLANTHTHSAKCTRMVFQK